jgi:WD40-like Beta Propeller Repeat
MLIKTSRLIVNAGILGAAAMLMAAAGGALAQTGEMVSLRSDGVPPDSMSVESSQPAVTPDGRYVVFLGSPTNLVPGVSAGYQIYLRDRVAGTVELISADNAGTPGNSSSNAGPTVSDDGCKVIFSSYASNLVAGDTNGAQDVFVRDRCSTPHSTSAVSVDTSGAVGNRGSNQARVSGNGRFVVFTSAADLVVPGPVTNNTSEFLYVRDLSTGTTNVLGTFVDSSNNTQTISGTSPDISADGSRVAFFGFRALSSAETFWQIYLYDRNNPGTVKIVSADAAGNPQGGSGGTSTVHLPALSADGHVVAFASTSNTLVSGVTDGNRHVYLKNVDTGAIELADVSSAGVVGDNNSSGAGSGDRPSISSDGTWVTFWTHATNLAPNSPFNSVILRNTVTRQTTLLTIQSTPSVPAISGDAAGRYIVFFSSTPLDPRFPTAVSAYSVRGYFLLDQFMNFAAGWNLVGDSSSGALNVATAFGDSAKVNTVWKWIAGTARWAFYAPSLVGQALTDYAVSKGYDVLTTINGGEGFWVNAKIPFASQLPAGTAITSVSFQGMASGWNLVSIGELDTAKQFCAAQSSGVTTLWAWDTTTSAWYFYAPSLDASGGLANYISSKGYLDFTQNNKSLGSGTGFWINKP